MKVYYAFSADDNEEHVFTCSEFHLSLNREEACLYTFKKGDYIFLDLVKGTITKITDN